MPEPRMSIGVDIGTTGCRACIVADASTAVAEASVPYEPERSRPGWAEQDAELWWEAFLTAVRTALSSRRVGHVSALALSSQSTALLPLDAHCKPLRKAIIWQDTRCAGQCEEIRSRFGEDRVRDLTGWKASTFLLWPKALWFQANEPDLFSATRWLLQVGDFITQRLCGRVVLARAHAVGYPMNVRTLQWHDEFCRWREFPVDKIPPVVPSVGLVGQVSQDASRLCGLPAGTPIVAGGMDTACAAFAVGAAAPGRAFEVSGTSGGVGIISEEPSPERRLGVAPHLFEGLYINHAPMSASGASLAWCVSQLCQAEQQVSSGASTTSYDVIEQEVSGLGDEPTGLLFLPYMAGERAPVWDPAARAAMLGLDLATSRPQIIKMIMEGVAYALRQNIDIAERGSKELPRGGSSRVTELRSCGGGSRSDVWCQIKADVTGRALVVHGEGRDAAFGAALLAGIGAGLWTRDEVEAALLRERPRLYHPRPEVTAKYAPYQHAYNQIYPYLREALHAPNRCQYGPRPPTDLKPK